MPQPDIDFSFGVSGTGEVNRALATTRSKIDGFTKKAGAAFLDFAAKAAKALAIVGTAMLTAFVANGIKSAIQLEQVQIQLENFTGSAQAATKVLGQIEDFAAKTPFQFPELAQASTKLLAFNIEQEKLLPTLKSLGDLAAGTGNNIGELAEIYGKARVQGRLFAEDINQFTGRGIPIIGELAKQFNVADSEVKKLVEDGKIGFPALEKAFQSLTSEGGKFFGLTEKLSKSTAGQLSTLRDNIGKVGRELGAKVLPLVSAAASDLTISIQRVFGGVKDLEGGSKKLDNILINLTATLKGIVGVAKFVIDAFKGIGNAISASFSFLDSTFGKLTDQLQTPFAQVNEAADKTFTKFADRVGISAARLEEFKASLSGSAAILKVNGLGIGENAEAMKVLDKAYQGFSKTREDFNKTIGAGFGGATGGGSGIIDKITPPSGDGTIKLVAGSIGFLEEQISKLRDSQSIQTTASEFANLEKQIESLNIQIGAIKFGTAKDQLDGFLETVNTVKSTSSEILPSFEEIRTTGASVIGRMSDDAAEKHAKMVESIKERNAELSASFKDIGRGALVDLAGGLGRAFGEAIAGTQSLADSLKFLALQIAQTATQAAGLALLQIAPRIPEPVTATAYVVAGLSLIGISGLLGGIAASRGQQGQGESQSFSEPGPSTAGPNTSGLSNFTGTNQEFQPIVNNSFKIELDGEQITANVIDRTQQLQNRQGR